jgi:ribonuclease HI
VKELFLFTDGSVNTQSKIGYGAILFVKDINQTIELLKPQVKLKRFEQTSSSKLELQTLLWALSEFELPDVKIKIYTDSQNIVGLNSRRERFEKNDYRAGNDKLLNNYLLYQEFFKLTDLIDCEFIKIQGHQPSKQKEQLEKIFSLVDKASRNAVRTI